MAAVDVDVLSRFSSKSCTVMGRLRRSELSKEVEAFVVVLGLMRLAADVVVGGGGGGGVC